MAADGVRKSLGLFTTAFSSYSSCRQYLENLAAAQAEVGHTAPRVDKLRAYYNHPGLIGAMTQRVKDAFDQLSLERRSSSALVYTAHSIPKAMADNCRYESQLLESCRLVSGSLGCHEWSLAYQSRSGPPSQPWIGPEIGDRLRELAATGIRDVVVAPIGFLSDHLEVLYDLDTEARQLCADLSLRMVRAATVGVHPLVISMFRELILERIGDCEHRRALGDFGPANDVCPADCCRMGDDELSRNPDSR
jgi:ferrochelatase